MVRLLLVSPLLAASLAAQDSLPTYVRQHYTKVDHQVPMRDGARLWTTVYTPNDTSKPYPILLTRTPYGSDKYLNPTGPAESFARAGYIFAFQDVRGKYRSEGDFANVPPHLGPGGAPNRTSEATDAYDAIDWLVKNVAHNNGSVGQYGISYLGYYSTMSLIGSHPALKAVSPQAPVTDWFVGDDWHHNGAFFLADGFGFLYSFGVPRPAPTTKSAPEFESPTGDSYRFFLDLGPLKNVDRDYYKGRIPFWRDLMAHGTYDAFWKSRTPLPLLGQVKPAVMTVGGWFDAEDLWGTLNVYQTIERKNPGAYNVLVMGPWFHGGWFLSDGSRLGDEEFGAKTSDQYHERIELPFFEHFLKGSADAPPPEASVFETGTNRWRTFDHWPPQTAQPAAFFLDSSESLSSRAPKAGFEEFQSDPSKPVPYIDGVVLQRPVEYMVADQRFASRRPDVLVYQTDPLTKALTIAGPIRASLWVSTTGTDADWVVKVIDVLPDRSPLGKGGYQRLVRADIMRGKFRRSYERPEPFVPGRPTLVEFSLPDALHTFAAGHRLMIQIQSSWFPLVDRNPQRFVDIYRATEGDFRKATHRVYHTAEHPSRIIFQTLPQ